MSELTKISEVPEPEPDPTPEPNPEPGAAPDPEPGEVSPEALHQPLDPAKLQEMQVRYVREGKLNNEDYEYLKTTGYDKAYVDGYLEGQKAKAELAQRQILDLAGGEDGYKSMCQWAKTNLSAKDINEFDAAVGGADMNAAMNAVRKLVGVYQEEVGIPGGAHVAGRRGTAEPQVRPYKFYEQFVNDCKKPEYQIDPEFRETCARRLAHSSFPEMEAQQRNR